LQLSKSELVCLLFFSAIKTDFVACATHCWFCTPMTKKAHARHKHGHQEHMYMYKTKKPASKITKRSTLSIF
jgi:hypothetical protein